MTDLLLYGSIYQWSAEALHDQVKEAKESDPEGAAPFYVRINGEGGEPEYGMSIIAKIQQLDADGELAGVLVEGQAHSMYLFLLAYLDPSKVKAIDTAMAVLHRAAYSPWMEKSEGFAGSIYEQMRDKTNKDLEKAFRAKVDVQTLENLPQFKSKGITLKDIFDTSKREEVLLSAQDLKAIGLVSEIQKVTPRKVAEIQALQDRFKGINALSSQEYKMAAKAVSQEVKQKNLDKPMDLQELKTKHPELYAQAKAEGAAEEKERVEAYLEFADIDLDAVKKGIEAGKPMSAKEIAVLAKKAAIKAAKADDQQPNEQTEEQKEALSALARSSAPNVETTGKQLNAQTGKADPKAAEEQRLKALRADIAKKATGKDLVIADED